MIKDRLVLLGVAGLAALATAGWVRSPQPVQPIATMPISNFQPLQEPMTFGAEQQFAVPVRAASYQEVGQPVRPVLRQRRADTSYETRNRRYEREPVLQSRSKTKSAVIIGSGAAAGAAIGGLAGGGKGAAIGALSGGAAGLIYDRLTKDRQPFGF